MQYRALCILTALNRDAARAAFDRRLFTASARVLYVRVLRTAPAATSLAMRARQRERARHVL